MIAPVADDIRSAGLCEHDCPVDGDNNGEAGLGTTPERFRTSRQQAGRAGSLLVFSDDWGRHPSSCQHIIRCLLNDFPVTWVNTIGTRAPRLDAATLRRVREKCNQWLKRSSDSQRTSENHGDCSSCSGNSTVPDFGASHELRQPAVVNPKMWPWFAWKIDRWLNRELLTRQLAPILRTMPQPVTAITTLPITADLKGKLPVSRWVYYCVDDFSLWPGLDGETLRRMDRDMIRSADDVFAVSETLRQMIAREGRDSTLLTHGVDVDFWRSACDGRSHANQSVISGLPAHRVVFWGVVDRRMETAGIVSLSQKLKAEIPDSVIVLIGPQQDPDPEILSLPNVQGLPPQPLSALPAIARDADVLMMPYADLPVTRAMQPLKLKEYMATGKPVVVNRLPSTTEWTDCLDEAGSPSEFSSLVISRIRSGVPPHQIQSRARLRHETWSARAEQLRTAFSKVESE